MILSARKTASINVVRDEDDGLRVLPLNAPEFELQTFAPLRIESAERLIHK